MPAADVDYLGRKMRGYRQQSDVNAWMAENKF